jgi:hypothetical protein
MKIAMRQLSKHSRKLLADSLRKKFAKSVPADLLDRLSDEDLIDHYFQNTESKIRSLRGEQ